jgi:hypothetical protein
LWHVGDPPEFWNADTVPLWAKQSGWWYDDSFPPKAQIDRELNAVLRNHPGLRLVLAHFCFLSRDLGAAAAFLNDHPGVNLDLAPGIEMYHNFTAVPGAAHDFFVKHSDRILFGTDTGIGNHTTGRGRGRMIRRFLETADRFEVPEDPFMTPDERPALHGLSLPAGALDRIYRTNFERWIGRDRPRPLDLDAARSLLRDLSARAAAREDPENNAAAALALL